MKQKIIEIYVEENPEEDSISFEVKNCENTEIANNTMKMLMFAFNSYKKPEDEMEVEYEDITEE